MNVIAKNIKKLRERKGLTQEELGEKLHVTRQAVSNWETGKNQPDIEMLISLAEMLEVDIKELLYGPVMDEWRQKRRRTAIVLCTLTVVAWAIYVPFLRYAQNVLKASYVAWPTYLCQEAIKPTAFFISGLALAELLLLALGRDLHSARPTLYRGALIFGGLFLLVYTGATIKTFLPGETPKWSWPFFRFVSMVWGHNTWTFLPIGMLVSFSINAVGAQKRKSG